MDIDQARTFLDDCRAGSFPRGRQATACHSVHRQRTRSEPRVRELLASNCSFAIARVTLTAAGRRFMQHAKTLVLTVEQATMSVSGAVTGRPCGLAVV